MSGMQTKTLWGAFSSSMKSFFNVFHATMEVVDNGVTMASVSVSVAMDKQAVDVEADLMGYEERSLNEAVIAMENSERKLVEYLEANPERKANVERTKMELRERVKKRKAMNYEHS